MSIYLRKVWNSNIKKRRDDLYMTLLTDLFSPVESLSVDVIDLFKSMIEASNNDIKMFEDKIEEFKNIFINEKKSTSDQYDKLDLVKYIVQFMRNFNSIKVLNNSIIILIKWIHIFPDKLDDIIKEDVTSHLLDLMTKESLESKTLTLIFNILSRLLWLSQDAKKKLINYDINICNYLISLLSENRDDSFNEKCFVFLYSILASTPHPSLEYITKVACLFENLLDTSNKYFDMILLVAEAYSECGDELSFHVSNYFSTHRAVSIIPYLPDKSVLYLVSLMVSLIGSGDLTAIHCIISEFSWDIFYFIKQRKNLDLLAVCLDLIAILYSYNTEYHELITEDAIDRDVIVELFNLSKSPNHNISKLTGIALTQIYISQFSVLHNIFMSYNWIECIISFLDIPSLVLRSQIVATIKCLFDHSLRAKTNLYDHLEKTELSYLIDDPDILSKDEEGRSTVSAIQSILHDVQKSLFNN